MRTILLVAGDPSGDLHGANLIRELKAREPSARIAAVGGPLMKAEAHEFLEDLATRGMTGFLEPLAALPFFTRLGFRLGRFMKERKVSALVCIDYYGFNRRVLSFAAAAKVPAYYYVSPQVWASRPGRIQVLKKLVRKMLVIFPFEEKLYREAGVDCLYVGHPLFDLMPPAPPRDAPSDKPLIGLLPGSRASEVRRHLPVFLKTFDLLKKRFPGARARLFAAASLPDSAYNGPGGVPLPVVRERDYALRSSLDFAISSSGTATLENALLGVPMAVVYKLSWPTYAIARTLIKVPYIAMANLLAGKRLAPELIQRDAKPEKIAAAVAPILGDPAAWSAVRRELLEIRSRLGSPGGAGRAAAEILQDSGILL